MKPTSRLRSVGVIGLTTAPQRQAAQATIKDGIACCETERDYASREVLQHILEDTEEHIDFLETEIELIDKIGLQNYLQSQIGEGKESS